MTTQGRKIESLNSLKAELDQLTVSLKTVQDPVSRIKIIEEFKKGLAELRKGVLEL